MGISIPLLAGNNCQAANKIQKPFWLFKEPYMIYKTVSVTVAKEGYRIYHHKAVNQL